MKELLKAMWIVFTREMDRDARDFISRHPYAVVVHAGCGLDSRFERVAGQNSHIEWYDLDLPNVVDLRRRSTGDEGECFHLLDGRGFYIQPEPRLIVFRWAAPIFRLFRPICTNQFQPGKAEG